MLWIQQIHAKTKEHFRAYIQIEGRSKKNTTLAHLAVAKLSKI